MGVVHIHQAWHWHDAVGGADVGHDVGGRAVGRQIRFEGLPPFGNQAVAGRTPVLRPMHRQHFAESHGLAQTVGHVGGPHGLAIAEESVLERDAADVDLKVTRVAVVGGVVQSHSRPLLPIADAIALGEARLAGTRFIDLQVVVRTDIGYDRRRSRRGIVRMGVGKIEVVEAVNQRFADLRQDQAGPGEVARPIRQSAAVPAVGARDRRRDGARRKDLLGARVGLNGQSNLIDLVGAVRPASRLARITRPATTAPPECR